MGLGFVTFGHGSFSAIHGPTEGSRAYQACLQLLSAIGALLEIFLAAPSAFATQRVGGTFCSAKDIPASIAYPDRC